MQVEKLKKYSTRYENRIEYPKPDKLLEIGMNASHPSIVGWTHFVSKSIS